MIRHGPSRLADGDLVLREISPADSERLYRWRMDPANRPMFRDTALVPFDRHERFVARYFEADNTDCWFVIEAGGVPVGTIALYGLSADRAEGEWGRLVIDAGHRGRGYGKRALGLLIRYAREIGVRRLRCEVLSGNDAAEKLYRAMGFEEVASHEYGGRRFLELVAVLSGDR